MDTGALPDANSQVAACLNAEFDAYDLVVEREWRPDGEARSQLLDRSLELWRVCWHAEASGLTYGGAGVAVALLADFAEGHNVMGLGLTDYAPATYYLPDTGWMRRRAFELGEDGWWMRFVPRAAGLDFSVAASPRSLRKVPVEPAAVSEVLAFQYRREAVDFLQTLRENASVPGFDRESLFSEAFGKMMDIRHTLNTIRAQRAFEEASPTVVALGAAQRIVRYVYVPLQLCRGADDDPAELLPTEMTVRAIFDGSAPSRLARKVLRILWRGRTIDSRFDV
jgi:hypothetical protein